jgi:hypothetical protein
VLIPQGLTGFFFLETLKMTNQAIVHVHFHESELFVIEHEGIPYTPMKPIVEGMGLTWQSQNHKLSCQIDRFCIKHIVMQVPSDDQNRSVMCMPLRKLFGWLMTVNPKKVKPEIRGNIVMYQNECDDVLWEHWTNGQARQSPVEILSNPFDDVNPAILRQLGKIGNGLPWAYLVSKGVTPELVVNLLSQNGIIRPVIQSDMFAA